MFSMFRFLMGDKSIVYRIIRLLILILFLRRDGNRYWTTIDGVRQLYRRIECKMCFEVIEKLKKL